MRAKRNEIDGRRRLPLDTNLHPDRNPAMRQSSFIPPPSNPPAVESPTHRVLHEAAALTPSELLSLILSGPQALDAARELFNRYSLYQLPKATLPDLLAVRGLGPANARRVSPRAA
jgi:hypothetical protein